MLLRSALALIISLSALHGAEWQKLEGCQLVADEYGDGDSFHVRQGDKDFIFRLYFVDCPETDNRFPERVAEQARYFGITSPSALTLGEKGKEFSFAALAKPFTVWTKWRDARGASKQHRFYAVLEASRGSLASLLVENGLARVFGVKTALPDRMKAETYVSKLRELEEDAKALKRGGWSVDGEILSNELSNPLESAVDSVSAF